MSATLRKKRAARNKRRVEEGRRRINKRLSQNLPGPRAARTHDDRRNLSSTRWPVASRDSAAGGIGAMLLLGSTGSSLIRDIDANLHLALRSIFRITNPTTS